MPLLVMMVAVLQSVAARPSEQLTIVFDEAKVAALAEHRCDKFLGRLADIYKIYILKSLNHLSTYLLCNVATSDPRSEFMQIFRILLH